jgi:uncharacterized protein
MRTLKPAHGNWVDGERFWGRKTELALFEEGLREGANYLLVAQRRMGKTSLMREIMQRLAGDFLCVFVDFEKADDAADAVTELSISLQPHKKLWTKTTELFGNVLRSLGRIESVALSEVMLTMRAGLTTGNWRSKGDELFEILAASEKPVVLLLDEVPILVNRLLKGRELEITDQRRADTEAFMSWLRHNTQRHQGKVRVVLSGSIGLEPVLRQGGLTATLNSFQPFELRPWDDETASGCFEALARGKGMVLEAGVPRRIIEQLGCAIPHHIQLFFAHAHTHCRRRGDMKLDLASIDMIYAEEMLSVRGHAELTHYEDRLKLILVGEALTLAMEMLTEAAVVGSLTGEAHRAFQAEPYAIPIPRLAEVQKEIIRVLEHDGYLACGDDGSYRFVSKLVRDWWKARNALAYVPVLQRRRA